MTTASEPLCDEIPGEGSLLGLDYGRVRIGVAVSTPEQNLAVPLETWKPTGDRDDDALHLEQLIVDQRVVALVVGLPLHADGTTSEMSREAETFGAWVRQATGKPVTFWDERYTSQDAEEVLLSIDMTRKKRKARLDMIAAQMILQGYLDRD
jgi:putative Holliday junction resolvase